MESGEYWILLFIFIFAGYCPRKSVTCGINHHKHCPKINVPLVIRVCYSEQHGHTMLATVTCPDKVTNHTCSSSTKTWSPTVYCSAAGTTYSSGFISTSKTENTRSSSVGTTKAIFSTVHWTTLSPVVGDYTRTTSQQEHRSGVNVAVYVVVSCVTVVLVAMVTLIILWIRQYRNKSKKHNGLQIDNHAYQPHDVTNNDSTIYTSGLSILTENTEYSDIRADLPYLFVDPENLYTTIDVRNIHQDDYSHLAAKTKHVNDASYSHISNTQNSNNTDNSYAHVTNGFASPQTELVKKDDTYNKLQTLPNTNNQHTWTKTTADKDDIEYNHISHDWKQELELRVLANTKIDIDDDVSSQHQYFILEKQEK